MTPQELLAMSKTGLLGRSVGADYNSTVVTSVPLGQVRLKALNYPKIIAPDTNYNYQNWHRVRILSVWLPTAATPWVRSGERHIAADPDKRVDTIQYAREVSWGLFGMIGTETWLVRRKFIIQFVQKAYGTVYVAERPIKSQNKQQTSRILPKDDEPIHVSDAPEPGMGETVAEMMAQRVLTPSVFAKGVQAPSKMVNIIRDPSSASPGPVLKSDGAQFVIGSLIRGLVKNNALMRSLYDAEAMWVEEMPAPSAPVYKSRPWPDR